MIISFGEVLWDDFGTYKSVEQLHYGEPTCSGDNCYFAFATCLDDIGYYKILKCSSCSRAGCVY